MIHHIHEHDRARIGECVDIVADFIDDIVSERTGILDDQVLPGDFRHEGREATLVESRGIGLRNLKIETIEIMEVLDFVDGDLQSIRTALRLDDHMVIVEFRFLLWNFMYRALDGVHRLGSCSVDTAIRCLCNTHRFSGWRHDRIRYSCGSHRGSVYGICVLVVCIGFCRFPVDACVFLGRWLHVSR